MLQGRVHFVKNFSERQILWSLCSVDFHASTLQLPIQTLHSVAPELQVFVSSLENRQNFSKTSTPQEDHAILFKFFLKNFVRHMSIFQACTILLILLAGCLSDSSEDSTHSLRSSASLPPGPVNRAGQHLRGSSKRARGQSNISFHAYHLYYYYYVPIVH